MPADADPSRVTTEDLKAGPRSIGVPGTVAATVGLHERHGRVPRAVAMAPAIRLAEEGFPLTVKNVEFIGKARPQLAHSSEAERTFLAGGEVPRVGSLLVQKDLGATLRQIAEGGAETFYRGPIAKAIARAMEAHRGWITEADLAGYRPTWGAPLAVPFRGHDVCVPPPPTNALQSVQTLKLLEGFDLRGMGHNSVEYLHHFIEAAKVASADRVGLDVLRPDAPIAGLISPRYAAHRRALIDPRRAGVSGGERWSAERLPGDDPDASQAVGAGPLGDPRRRDLLIARRDHLVPRRQVHPHLEPVDAPAVLPNRLRRHLGVHHSTPGRHPLDVAGGDPAAVPGGVLVLERSLEHVGHRLEPAVRMIGRSHGLARAVVGRTHLVEEEKRIHQIQSRGRERTPHHETAAFELPVCRDDLFDLASHDFHPPFDDYPEYSNFPCDINIGLELSPVKSLPLG